MPEALQLVPSPAQTGAGAWTFEPLTTLALLAFAVAVTVGAVRMRRGDASPRWSGWRALSLGVGIVAAVVLVDGWPGVYARTLMSAFVSQNLALLLICPVLIAYGRPLVPLRALAPSASLPPGPRRVYRALTHAMVGPLYVPIVLSVLVFTRLPATMSQHVLVAGGVHLVVLFIGLAIAAPLAREVTEDAGSSLAFGLALAVGVAELLIDAIPGIALRLNTHVLPAIISLAGHRHWGPSPILDQQAAGDILWSVAELLDLPFVLIVLVKWFRADEHEARRIDAQLERARMEAALRRPVTVAEATGEAPNLPPERDRPWWEQDAQVFGDVRSRRFQHARPVQDEPPDSS